MLHLNPVWKTVARCASSPTTVREEACFPMAAPMLYVRGLVDQPVGETACRPVLTTKDTLFT